MKCRVMGVDELSSGEARAVTVDGHRIAVVRIDDEWFALDDTCSHANVSLSEGEVLRADCEIECWKHGSTFSLLSGEPQSLPATRPVPVYPVHLEGDDVIVSIP